MFLLLHKLHCAYASTMPLFLAFLDFEKAYDRVDRDLLLWKLVHFFGVRGPMLRVLRSLYDRLEAHLRADPFWATFGFTTKNGLRQGCVLSPLLFICFICDLEAFVAGRPAGTAAARFDELVALAFADDVAIWAHDLNTFRQLLERAVQYSRLNGQRLNEKCDWMVFVPPGARAQFAGLPSVLVVGGGALQLERRNKRRYLGAMFDSDRSDTDAMRTAISDSRMQQARHLLYQLGGGLRRVGRINPEQCRKLWFGKIQPVVFWTAEVTLCWPACPFRNYTAIRLLREWVACSLDLPADCSTASVLWLLGCRSPRYHQLKRTLSFARSVALSEEQTAVRQVLDAQRALCRPHWCCRPGAPRARTTSVAYRRTWLHRLCHALQSVRPVGSTWSIEFLYDSTRTAFEWKEWIRQVLRTASAQETSLWTAQMSARGTSAWPWPGPTVGMLSRPCGGLEQMPWRALALLLVNRLQVVRGGASRQPAGAPCRYCTTTAIDSFRHMLIDCPAFATERRAFLQRVSDPPPAERAIATVLFTQLWQVDVRQRCLARRGRRNVALFVAACLHQRTRIDAQRAATDSSQGNV